MIDVALFLVASAVLLGLLPLLAARRTLPRVLPGPELRLEALDDAQRRYEAGFPLRLATRLAAPLLFAYFVARSALGSPARLDTRWFTAYVVAVGLGVTAGTLAAAVGRYRWDRRFAAEHPRFADSIQPLGLRLLGPLLILLCFVLLAGATRVRDGALAALGLGAALVLLVVGQKILLARVVRTQIPVPPDSPLGRASAEAVVKSGFTPKRTILVPSTVANAFALPDGTVMVTTAMHHVASDAEIAAILAHELSHARDGDVKRLRRASLLGILVMAVLAVALSVPTAFLPGSGPFFVPLVVLAVACAIQLASLVRTGVSRRLEFKCDRAAAALGFGEALASGLVLMHRYNGVPHRWRGYEARVVTHPALDDRLAVLKAERDGA